jgi:hypothetical protein
MRAERDSLHLLVDPTCERHRSKARDAARSGNTANANEDDSMGVETLDEKGSIESNVAELPQYPARPHGTWDEYVQLSRTLTSHDIADNIV